MGQSALTWYSVGAWKKPVWYTLTYSTLFDDNIANLEKVNVGEYVFETGVCVPGLDNFKSKARDVIRNLEK